LYLSRPERLPLAGRDQRTVVGFAFARSIKPPPSSTLRYWNLARQRHCRPSAPYHRATSVSPDRAACSAPHTGGKSPAFRRERAKSRETRTLRWREADANHRSRSCERLIWALPIGDGCTKGGAIYRMVDYLVAKMGIGEAARRSPTAVTQHRDDRTFLMLSPGKRPWRSRFFSRCTFSRGINSGVASHSTWEFYDESTGMIPHRDVLARGNRQNREGGSGR